MNFLIEYQYVILYFSGAFFSFFAMISYVKFGSSFVGGKRKLENPEDFFDDFDNDDLEALLDESFDVDNSNGNAKAAAADLQGAESVSFLGRDLEIEKTKSQSVPNPKNQIFVYRKGE